MGDLLTTRHPMGRSSQQFPGTKTSTSKAKHRQETRVVFGCADSLVFGWFRKAGELITDDPPAFNDKKVKCHKIPQKSMYDLYGFV